MQETGEIFLWQPNHWVKDRDYLKAQEEISSEGPARKESRFIEGFKKNKITLLHNDITTWEFTYRILNII